ncbi:hypothetical protein KCU73_g5102, partial [Aureobasidium melanogenum]
MSSTTNTHDETAATAATVSNHYSRVDFLEGSATTENHNTALTSRDDSDDHASKSESLTGSRNGPDEKEQAHIAKFTELCKSFEPLRVEMKNVSSNLYLCLFRDALDRDILYGPLTEEPVQLDDLSGAALDSMEHNLNYQQTRMEDFNRLYTLYKNLTAAIRNTLGSAEEVLENASCLVDSDIRKSVGDAVALLEEDAIQFHGTVNGLLRTVFMTDKESWLALANHPYLDE